MTIYIDSPNKGWSHMVSDNIKELHIFATSIGIKKCWYQNKKGKHQPHYDVNKNKFQTAIDNGAVLVSSKYIVEFLNLNFKK